MSQFTLQNITKEVVSRYISKDHWCVIICLPAPRVLSKQPPIGLHDGDGDNAFAGVLSIKFRAVFFIVPPSG